MKNRTNFWVWLVGSTLLMAMFFQNCGKKQAVYETVGSPSSTNLSSNSPVGTLGYTCQLNSNTIEVKLGQSVTYSIQPNPALPAGFRVFWYGSRTDVDGSNYQALPSGQVNYALDWQYTYDTAIPAGYYTRSVQIQDPSGNLLCSSNSVRVLHTDSNPVPTTPVTTPTLPLFSATNCPGGKVLENSCIVKYETKDLTPNGYLVVAGDFASFTRKKAAFDALCKTKATNLIAVTTDVVCQNYQVQINGRVSIYLDTITTATGDVPLTYKNGTTWVLSTSLATWANSPTQGVSPCAGANYLKTLTCRAP